MLIKLVFLLGFVGVENLSCFEEQIFIVLEFIDFVTEFGNGLPTFIKFLIGLINLLNNLIKKG